MGSQFSAGPFIKEVDIIVNLRITKLRAFLYHLERIRDTRFEEAAFLTKKQLQLIMKFSDRTLFNIFNLFDPQKSGKISRQEFFGAMSLASCDSPSDKVGLGFMIADENNDGYVSKTELEVLFICATRGLALMKNNEAPPIRTIHKIVNFIFNSRAVVLNEKGWINAADVKAFCQANDLCRTYFADLGTQVEIEDSSKLVAQRKNLQFELLKMESKLTTYLNNHQYKLEDENIYKKERGGDYLLLKFNPEDVDYNSADLKDSVEDEIYIRAKKKLSIEDDKIDEVQRLRRLKRRLNKKDNKSNLISDALVFARGLNVYIYCMNINIFKKIAFKKKQS